jgi:predicted DNA-binding transcriptional regulator AlpA
MREARAVWKTARAVKRRTPCKEGTALTVSNETQSERQAAVYRLYAADGSLLYIGSSYNPERRYRDHYSKPWWPLVARRVEEWHPSKDDAYAAEMKAIAAEGPAHNHMGTPQYVPPSEKAAAQRRHISGELTVKEIMATHGISRQSLHTYRQDPGFPSPVSRPGTGGLRWREDELAAWFAVNPKQQGKKREQFVSHQQGEPGMKTYVLTLRIEADSEVTPEQIRQEIYDACADVPFGFDITSVEQEG